jgi:hypothetical protein
MSRIDAIPRFYLMTLAAAAIGAVLCVIGAVIDATGFLRGWLAAWSFWIGLPLGALMLLMAHDLTGGRWGTATGAPLAAAAATLPLAAVLFIPILLGLGRLYPWARPEEAAHLANHFYLNVPFFVARTVVYFVLWCLLAWLAARRRPPEKVGGATAAAPSLIVLALTSTFAAFDWTMSLQPDWSSSIYGMLVIGGDLIGALSAATFAAIVTRRATTPGERTDLGSLLIAGILVWAYFAFMQFLIIWEEDLPKEITWYLPRIAGGWGGVAVAIALGQGLLPFLALIWWPVKRSRAGLASVCCLLLAAHLLECWWLVLPGSADGRFTWQVLAATLAIGGIWCALFGWRLETGRLLPIRLDRRHAGSTAAEARSHG